MQASATSSTEHVKKGVMGEGGARVAEVVIEMREMLMLLLILLFSASVSSSSPSGGEEVGGAYPWFSSASKSLVRYRHGFGRVALRDWTVIFLWTDDDPCLRICFAC